MHNTWKHNKLWEILKLDWKIVIGYWVMCSVMSLEDKYTSRYMEAYIYWEEGLYKEWQIFFLLFKGYKQF